MFFFNGGTYTLGTHSLTVRSFDADAIRFPVGEYVTSLISAYKNAHMLKSVVALHIQRY